MLFAILKELGGAFGKVIEILIVLLIFSILIYHIISFFALSLTPESRISSFLSKIDKLVYRGEVNLELKKCDPFWTSKQHRARWKIKYAKLSPEDEKKLHSMILNYYENYFKENNEHIYKYFKTEIKSIEFSRPKRYKNLKDKIGIITCGIDPSFSLPVPCLCAFQDIFIFERINDRWKIIKEYTVFKGNIKKVEQFLIQELSQEK